MTTKFKMSNKTKVIIPFLVLLITVLFISDKKSFAFSSGAPSGVTGSPGDGSNCTQCHSGTAQTLTSGITTTIPITGYVPGTTYDIIIGNEVAQSGKIKYGFAMTVQQGTSQTLLGSFTPKSGLTIASNYITHDGAISAPPSWLIKWTAPNAGTGALNIYTAINAANGSGAGGDQILTSIIPIQEAKTTSVNTLNNDNASFKAFINGQDLNLTFTSSSVNLFYLQVIDLKGNVVLTKHINGNIGENNHITSLEKSLSSGVYIVKLSDFKQNYEAKIAVK
jgi:hypothetical protein